VFRVLFFSCILSPFGRIRCLRRDRHVEPGSDVHVDAPNVPGGAQAGVHRRRRGAVRPSGRRFVAVRPYTSPAIVREINAALRRRS